MSTLRHLIALSCLISFPNASRAAEVPSVQGGKRKIESISPDRRFAFRYSGSETEGQTYELVSRKSGKVLAGVAESDPNWGPSARFIMKVLWRPDSTAFALTAALWKRGSNVSVYVRDGARFREVKLPELEAEIPDRVKKGKDYPHIVALNSQSAKRWQKDGSLVIEIENMQDGNDGSITAHRTVVLRFGKSTRAKVVKSTIKFSRETP